MANELAVAYVGLSLSARGLRGDVDKAMGGATAGVGQKHGRTMGSRLASAAGKAAKAGMVAVGVAAGAAVVGGFKSAISQENTEKTLGGLYGSTSKATDMMGRLKDIAKGSPIDLSAYSKGAETMAYMGVEGEQAQKILENVGAAVTAAGGSGEEMGRASDAMLKMVNAGKVQLDTLNQLSEAGVPIFSGLSKHFGVSIAEVRDMVTAGKVGMDDVLAVTENATGKTFQQMKKASDEVSKSFGNQWKIAKDQVVVALGENMVPLMEKMAPLIGKAGENIAGFIDNFAKGEGSAGLLRDALEGVGGAFRGIGRAVKDVVGFFEDHTTTAKILGGVLVAALAPVLAGLTAAWIVMKVEATKAAFQHGLAALKVVAGWVMMGLQATLGALKVAAAWLIAIGPIALVIAAVIGIGILIYKNWDSIKKWTKIAWDAIVGFVVAAWDKIVGAVKGAWDKVVGWSQAAWGKIKDIAGKLAPLFSRAKDGIVNAFKRLYKILTFPFRAAYVFWDITVHALIYIFKKVRDKVKSVWDKVRAIVEKPIRKAVDWVRRYIDNMRRGFRIIRDKIKELWDKARGIVEKPIRKAVDWVVKKVMQIRDRFMHLRNRVRILWNKAQEIVQRPIRRAVVWVLKKIMDIRDKFQVLRNRVKSIWDKVQGIVKRPIRLAVDWAKRKADQLSQKFTDVRDKIGRGWRKLQSLLKKPIIGAIKWINDKFLGPVGGKKGINGMLAKIGVGDKYQISNIRGFASGGYTGPGSKMTPAGVVHADEFVVRKKARGRFERDNPGVLDHINRTGRLPGYAIGGKVAGLNKRFLEQLGRFNAAAGNRYHVNSGYRSNAHQARLYALYLAGRNPLTAPPGRSQHNKGLAADLAPSDARNRHGNLASKFGLAFTVPSESWHIEPAWGRGSNAGPSLIGGLFDTVKDALRGLTDKGKSLLKNVPGSGMIPPMVKGIGSKVVKGAKSWVKPSLESMLSFIPGSGAMKAVFGKIKKGSNQFLGRQMAKNGYGWTGGQWSALNNLWTKESNWNHKARNASSGAYGIPQSLPGSKMASSGSDWRTSASTQIKWGLKYIKERYGSPSAAWAHSKRTNWYADGGRVTPAVFDNGGTLAPGLNLVNNKLGKPEALVRPEQMGSPQVNITFAPGTEWLADFVQTEITYADAFAGAQGRMA